MDRLKDAAAYWVVRFLIFLFGLIPLGVSLKIGECLGKAVFYFSGKRRVAYVNLKNALGEKLTSKQRWKAVRDHFGLIGQNAVEVMSFRKLTRAHIEQNVRINGLEKFRALAESGRGGVLLTGHFGNWELLQVVAGLLGTPIHVLARDQKYPKLNELLNQLRETHGSVAVSRGAGLRALVRALRDGKLIGVLGDQSAGKTEGILLPFFGRKTSVPVGAFELAIRTNALLMPCFMVRHAGIKHEIFVGKVLDDDPAKHNAERVELLARQYISALEDFIGRYPDQWLWENKRWKYSWDRKILILSDGKAGHFKQSEVIAGLLSEFREFHGRAGLGFRTEEILVEYRSGWHRIALFILAPFLRPWIQGRLCWLRPFLKEESQKAIEKAAADFIIAAGSGLAPVQQLLAEETGAKKVVVMKPPFPYAAMDYDLAVVPAHDSGLMPKRNFRCVIMPSGYQTADRSSDVARLMERLQQHSFHPTNSAASPLSSPAVRERGQGEGECIATEEVKIAVFVGGKTRGFDITVPDAEKLAAVLKSVAKNGAEYMLTTSRRTSSPVEQFLKSALGQDPACRLLVIANEDNPVYAAGGMMGAAEIIIVTGDSLAMISEAVGTGKKVIMLDIGQGDLPAKHCRFHEILARRGLVTVSCLSDLEKRMTELMKAPAHNAAERERAAFIQRLGELL